MRNLLILSGLIFLATHLKAQDIYADSQTNSTTALTCTSCGVTNPGNAVDASLSNFSTLGIRIALTGGEVEQTFSFPSQGLPGDTVVLTLEIPYAPAALDPNTLIFNSFNAGVSNGEALTTQFKAVAPSGGGSFQFIFMPADTFDAVQMVLHSGSVASILGGADSINVYSVRILNTTTTIPSTPQPIAGCEDPISEVDSVSALCLGFCAVENPSHILTPDPTDFTTLRISTILPNTYAAISGYYADTACSTDTVVIALEDATGQLSLGSYPNITINALLGNTIVGGGTLNTFAPTSISMVGNIVYVSFVPGTQFDGIRVVNTAGALSANNVQQLRLYQFCLRRLAPPVPTNGRVAAVCYNTPYTIDTQSPPGTIARYYDSATSTTILGTGPSYTTGNLTDTTVIYFESYNITSGCVSVERDSVVINVYPQVTPPNDPQDTVFICYNNPAIVAPQPFGSIYNFYSDSLGANLLGSGQFFVTDTNLVDTVIYVENTYLGMCNGGVFVPVYIRIIPDAFTADIEDTLKYCLNSTVTLTIDQPNPGITYKWYDQSGTLVFTGNPYPNFLVDQDSTLFIETLFGPCTQSPNRKRVDIIAVDQSTIDVFIFSPVYVCDDDTAVGMATSTNNSPDLEYIWFDENGTQVFNGNPYLVRSPVDSVTYFVTTRIDRCTSSDTAAYTVINLNTITDQAFDSTASVCSGNSAVLTSNIKVPGASYTWFDQLGNVVANTDTFVTPPLSFPAIYYFEISNVSCLNGATRHPIYVSIIAFPPTATVDTNLVYACSSDQATVVATAAPAPAIITWYDAPSNGTALFQGDTFRFPIFADTTIVYAEASIDQCVSSQREAVLVVNADFISDASANNDTICEGSSTQLSATSQIVGGDFSWWDAPNGGNRLATGNPFNTPILNNTTTYYVQVEFGYDVCSNRSRTPVTVQVERILSAPVVTCGPATNTSLSFQWTGDAGTQYYEISLDGGSTFFAPNNANGPRTHQINGLTPDSVITAIVRSIGARPCQNSPYSVATSCRATDCTPVNATLDKVIYEQCDDEIATINVQNLPPNYRIEFNGGAPTTNTSFTLGPLAAGTYTVPIIVYVQGETSCDTLHLAATVRFNPSPVAMIDAIALTPAIQGNQVNTFQFISNTVGDAQWFWNFGDGTGSNEKNPSHQYAADGSYQVSLYVVNSFGCDASDTLDRLIKVSRVPEIFIPNTFTPNADGKNDLLKVYGQNIRLESFKIFNTYGNIVFESKELARGWNGTFNGEPAPMGTYYYTAIIYDELNIRYEKEGTITLIRK